MNRPYSGTEIIGRIALHGGVLAACNLAAVIAAFVVYSLLRPANQILVQAPLAALFTVGAFLVWLALCVRLPIAFLQIRTRNEWAGIFVASLLWTPLLFIPLHWVTQGYLTSFDNILATWTFQVPVNLAALFIGYWFANRNKHTAPQSGRAQRNG